MDEKKRSNANGTDSGQTLEQLSAELDRIRKREANLDAQAMWSERELKAHRRDVAFLGRKMRWLAATAALLLIALGGGGLWLHQQLQGDRALLGDLPDAETLVQAVDERVDAFAETLADMSAESQILQGLADRIARLEGQSRQDVASLREQIDSTNRIDAEARLESARMLEEMGPRIEDLESARVQALDERDRLEEEIRDMRLEVATELAGLRYQTADALRAVEGQVAGNARGVEAVSWEVGRERLDFELFEDDRREVAPGVYLNVSHTDVGHQKIDGWLHLVREGRFVWFDDQAIQESFVFYGLYDERPYELVFTRVKPDAAIGYVRVPSEDGVRAVNQVMAPDFEGQLTAGR